MSRENDGVSGTVACIAGWTVKALALGPQSYFGEAREALGIPGEASFMSEEGPRNLFYPGEPYYQTATPAQAVAVLRHRAATGKVDWSVADSLPNQGTDR